MLVPESLIPAVNMVSAMLLATIGRLNTLVSLSVSSRDWRLIRKQRLKQVIADQTLDIQAFKDI
jgi:hypothetical protein